MIKIAGMGWITPLGAGLDEVCDRIAAGEKPEFTQIAHPETGHAHQVYGIPAALTQHLGRTPRLRRSSPISYYTVAAALAAIADAGLEITPAFAERTAVVFAAVDGSVVYTRKFYDQLVKLGAQAASPLLFPETVYNAPASHLAAQLGLDGASYTLVGDATAGLSALALGEQLIECGEAEHCVVAAGEELDWILCEAYHDWRFARTPLSEGAAALVLSRTGKVALTVAPGFPFFQQREAAAALAQALRSLKVEGAQFDLLASCGNGGFINRVESQALAACGLVFAADPLRSKQFLGESLGASALMQVVHAAQMLRRKGGGRALATVVGFNQQAGAAILACGQGGTG